MANERDTDFETPERESPYQELDLRDDEENFDDEYEYEYDDDDEEYAPSGLMGFLSTVQGKVLAIAIALLLAILIGVVIWRFVFFKPADDTALPPAEPPVTQTQEPDSTLVFGPAAGQPEAQIGDSDGDNADADVPIVFGPSDDTPPVSEPEETEAPKATETPLPIILSNTPTPTPTAAPTATPSPSPEITPTPTPRVDIGTGKTNRDARLRASMSANASVKKTVARGETVTIHEAATDSDGKLWYAVTVDDIATEGWMRDYVVTLDGKLATPAPSESGEPEQTAAPTATPEGVIGTGKTNRDPANVRKIMNGQVIVQLRKNRPVSILDVKQDKNGDTWYQIRTENGKVGFVRDYVITLDKGVTLPEATVEPAKEETATLSAEADTSVKVETAVPDTSAAPNASATLDASTEPTPTPTPSPEELILQREVIGSAVTNREANVRERPDGKVVRQLSKKTELRLLEKFEVAGKIWYEVATETGKTHGYVRDYVIDITEIDMDLAAKPYPPAAT